MVASTTMPSKWTSADIPDLSGKMAVVTGANSGLGREIAKRLAEHGAMVVMACRTVSKAETVKKEVIKELGGKGDLKVMELDVSNMESVRGFSETFLAQYSQLDMLMCNAGVMAIENRTLSADGYEMQFATNHLGHYLLVGLLLPLLKKTQGSRIVMQSSAANYFGKFNWDDLNAATKYDPWAQYMMTKLANITFANELQRRLSVSGDQTPTVYSAHPGYVATNLQGGAKMGAFEKTGTVLLAGIRGSVETGSHPALFPLTSPDAEPSAFYGPKGLMQMGGKYPGVKKPNKLSKDSVTMKKLWEYSEKATGFMYSL